MDDVTTPAGWYPDPSGAPGQRYFDGTDWTEHRSAAVARMSDAERADRLNAAVAEAVRYGARVESQTPFQAILIYGHPVNHVAHLLGVIFTCGIWLIGWLIAVAMEKPERRVVLRVDQYGNIV